MKNLGISFVMSLFIGILLFNGVCNAQNKTQPCKTCDQQEMAFEQYNSQREMTGQSTLRLPEFSGGMDSLYLYMAENLEYPDALKSSKAEGTTLVQFTVGIDGEISSVSVVRSSGYPEMDEEAVRLVESFPNWKPAAKNGEAMAMKTQLPVRFVYYEEDEE
jgi:protein TonB